MGGTVHQLGTIQTTRIWSNKLIGYTESKRIKLWNSNRLLSLHLNIIFIYYKGWGNLFVDFVVAGEHAVKLEENGNVSFQRSACNGSQKYLFQMIGVVYNGCSPKMLKIVKIMSAILRKLAETRFDQCTKVILTNLYCLL